MRRLRSTNLGRGTLLLGKLIPYIAVNQLHGGADAAAGCWLVPLLGGEALRIGGSWFALVTISASLSIAALGLALLIAVVSRTTEQATLLGGTGKHPAGRHRRPHGAQVVMPEAMRAYRRVVADVLGLKAFSTSCCVVVALRAIAPEAAGLTGLGLVAILLAGALHQRRID